MLSQSVFGDQITEPRSPAMARFALAALATAATGLLFATWSTWLKHTASSTWCFANAQSINGPFIRLKHLHVFGFDPCTELLKKLALKKLAFEKQNMLKGGVLLMLCFVLSYEQS